MKTVPIILVGFGPVGQAFVKLVAEKRHELSQKYELNLRLKAILRSSVAFLPPYEEIDFNLLDHMKNQAWWKEKPSLDWLLQQESAGVLIEVTSSNLETGQPAYDHIKKSLLKGWHVVTANKGPLVRYYSELSRLARINNLKLKFSGATAAALPALDVGLISLAGTKILKIEGILNGTTNFILTQMGYGQSFEASLREAQDKGIAEKDPTYDLEGWDTAVKLALLAAALTDSSISLEEIEVKGIKQIKKEEVVSALSQGKKIKLLGRLTFQDGQIKAMVKPEAIDNSHPLFNVDFTNKGITFYTDTMGTITIIGGQSDPRGAAAALLKDLINIYR